METKLINLQIECIHCKKTNNYDIPPPPAGYAQLRCPHCGKTFVACYGPIPVKKE